jgi:hypothetical protein
MAVGRGVWLAIAAVAFLSAPAVAQVTDGDTLKQGASLIAYGASTRLS